MANKAQQVRDYLVKNPTIDPKIIAKLFDAHLSQVYVIRAKLMGKTSVRKAKAKATVNSQITDAVTQFTPSNHANHKQVGGDHYMNMGVQPWKAMECWMTPEEFRGFLKGNAIKYLARSNTKGGVTDLRKAYHYLEKLIEEVGDE